MPVRLALLWLAALVFVSACGDAGSPSAPDGRVPEGTSKNTGGVKSSAEAKSETAIAEETAFVESVEEAATAVELVLDGRLPEGTQAQARVWRFEGGPVVIRVAVFNDWDFEGLGRRRTLLASRDFFPVVRPFASRHDPGEHTFDRSTGLVAVVHGGQACRVAVRHQSEDPGGWSASSSEFPVPEHFSRTDVRLQRAFTMEELEENSEETSGFFTKTTPGKSTADLRGREFLPAGAPRSLYSEWPIRWGPDTTPIVLEVTARRLPLPARYDPQTLRETIERLRSEVEEDAASAAKRYLLAVCSRMLSRVDVLDPDEARKLDEECVEQLRAAVAADPSNATFRDGLRRALSELAWRVAGDDDYRSTPDLLAEMLRQRPNFDDFDRAARTRQRAAVSGFGDASLNEQQRAAVFERYRRQATDDLRRGMLYALDHGGVEMLRHRRDYVAGLLENDVLTRTPSMEQLLVEFEDEPDAILENVARLQAGGESPPDADDVHLLAASFGMLALRAGSNENRRSELQRAAVEHARRAVAADPENAVYQRRLRRQLLDYAWTVCGGADYAQTPALVDEALAHAPPFAEYVRGAGTVAQAALTAAAEKHRGERTAEEAARPYREHFVDLLRSGLENVRETHPDDLPWLVEQLPAAVPYYSIQWPEFLALLEAAADPSPSQ